MSGLILLFILAVWNLAAIFFIKFLTSKIKGGVLKIAIQIILFAVVITAPLADEIIGGFQFRTLCEAESQVKYDKDKMANIEVKSDMLAAVKVEGLFVPVVSQTQTYTNTRTGKKVLYFKAFDADGGWLSRAISFNSVQQPYTFYGHCGHNWTWVSQLFASLNVTITNITLSNGVSCICK